nr:MAG TPA: hypothetical protein [Caudoviricetes sp.]
MNTYLSSPFPCLLLQKRRKSLFISQYLKY